MSQLAVHLNGTVPGRRASGPDVGREVDSGRVATPVAASCYSPAEYFDATRIVDSEQEVGGWAGEVV